ncbi:MAG TPA: Ig-like domain-containing protein [Noviherbaspirillum sp.]
MSAASSALAATIDTTAPAIASASVSGTTLTLTYTEAGVGMASTTPAASDFAVSKNGGTAVAVNAVSVDTAAKTVTLTLASAITNADSNIVVSYTAGASKLQDIAGNEAANVTNQAVTNSSSDTTAPAAPSLDLTDGSDTGTLNSDDKTSDTTPTIRVSLNGSGATAPVSGDVVKLFENGVEVGSATLTATDITNDYVDITSSALGAGSKSFTATITDAASNTSAASSALAVTIDTTAPAIASASVSGTTLTLTYTEAGVGMASTTPAASDFAVSKNGGTAVTVNSVAVDAAAKTVTLTLASAITNADSNIAVSYTAGASKLQDIAGNEAANLTNQAVTNSSSDTTAPAAPSLDLTDGSDSGTSDSDDKTSDTTPTIRVSLNGSGATAPVSGDVVKLFENGVEVGSATLNATDIGNDYVDITSSALSAGSKSFTATITDAANNVSAASSALAATIDTTVPAIASATVSGTTLTLTYTEAGVGMASTTPAASDFAVSKNGGTAVTVNSVAVDAAAKTVTLTLASAITNADSNIVVSYTAGASKLQDIAGNEAANLTNQAVTNSSSDTTAPAAPALSLLPISDSGSSSSDAYTNDSTPTIRVSLQGTGVTAPVAGDVVKLYLDATQVGSASLSTTDIANGYVDITASSLGSDGGKSLTATVTDAASNTSAASTALTLTLDTVVNAPSVALASDTGNSSSDGITSSGALSITGIEAGASIQYRTDGVTWTSSHTPVQGVNTVDVRQIDLAGNISGTASVSFTLDTTIATPGIALQADTGISSSDRVTNNGAVSVSGIEPGATLEYSRDGSSWSGSVTAVEGSNTIYVRQTDSAGNVSGTASTSFTLDTTVATPVLTLQVDSGTSGSDRITNNKALTLSGVETGATVHYSTDGSNWNTSYSIAEGNNTVYVRQTDVAGNTSGTSSVSLVLDTTVATPTVSLQRDTGASNTDRITADPTLDVGGIEANASVEYSADGINWASSFTATEGQNTVRVRQTDIAGNVSGIAALSFIYEPVPDAPGVQLSDDTGTSGSDRITRNGSLTLSGVKDGASVQYSTDGVNWTSAFTPVEGSNTVYVRQTTVNGTASEAATLTFTLDTRVAPPTVSLVTDSGASASDAITNTAALSVGGVEAGATVQYSADGTNWSGGEQAVEGMNTVLVRQIDLAGNVSGASSLTYRLDTQVAAPGISAAAANSSGVVSDSSVSLSGIESGASVEYSTDGTSWSGGYTAVEGANTIYARQTDLAGNVSPAASVSFTLNTLTVLPGTTTPGPTVPGNGTVNNTTTSGTGTTPPATEPGSNIGTGDTGRPTSEGPATPASAADTAAPILTGSQSAAPATGVLVSLNNAEQTSTQPTGRINLLAGIPLPPDSARPTNAGPESSILASTDRGFPVSRVQTTNTPGANDPAEQAARPAAGNAAIDQAQQKGNDRLFVYQGIRDTAIQGGVSIDYFVPREAFGHTNVNAVVQLDATLLDGSPLPEWLDFDPVSGRFSGRPPAGENVSLDIKVVARDNDGREASSTFKIKVQPGAERQANDADDAKPPAQKQAAGTDKDPAARKTAEGTPRKATPFAEQLRMARPSRDPLLARIAAADGKGQKIAKAQRTS